MDWDLPLQLLVDASATLLGPLDPGQLLPRVLELAQKLNSAGACAIWRQEDDSGDWEMMSALGFSAEATAVKLPGATAQHLDDSPRYFEDVFAARLLESRRAFYEREGVKSMALAPLKRAGQISGTLVFYYRETHHFTEPEKRVIESLGHLASSAIERAELNSADARARVRSGLLAEASAVLASSLDYETTLKAVARLAIGVISDWCVVDVHEPGGEMKLLEVAHSDPEKVKLALELRGKYPSDPKTPTGAAQVMATGKPGLVPEITDAMLRKAARDERHGEMLTHLGFRSWMCVPMVARNRVVGAISFVSGTAGRRFGAEDLAFAEDLARRAAMAIDNSMLYAGAQRERTALEVALAALRENEDRLLMALDAGRMGIWEWDIASGELTWSENLQVLHGFEPGTFDGRYETLLGLIHKEDRGAFEAAVARALAERAPLQVEFRIVPRDGSVRWQAGIGKLMCDEGGNPVKMIGLGMDITERRLLEDKLRNSQKSESIGLLAGGIAHDFNNLLTGILGNASLALDLLPRGSEVGPLLEHVIRASERAADLTQQLLAYSGKGRFVIQQVDLSALVEEIAGLVHASIPKLVRLELDLDRDLPAIEADASQLQQVVMNLAINAAESMEGNAGVVRMTTGIDAASGQVCLDVVDEGCGMDAATQARIFDPFFTTKFTGRGLGLAAVSGIVRAHNGSIEVESLPGRGSRFRVLLKASAARAQAAAGDRAPAGNLRGSGLVLLVDDEETVRTTASAALRRYGYEVECAEDGAAAVAAFARRPMEFDAVLLDMTMPVMDGRMALAKIRAIRADVPVLASSGYSELEAARVFGTEPVSAFVQKPYTAARLAAAVRGILPRHAAGFGA